MEKKFKVPHIYVILCSIILTCTIATHILPAGEFERTMSSIGREVVVPGTYHTVEATPVGFFAMLQSLYKGLCNAAEIVFFTFLAYAAMGLVIQSGAFNGLISWLLKILKGRARLAIIPILITVIGAISSTIGLYEEMLPIVPVVVGLSIAMGYDALVGCGIVAFGLSMGLACAAMNPFIMGIAKNIAGLPLTSGAGYRIFCHITMIIITSCFMMNYAAKIQKDPTKSMVYGDDFSRFRMDIDLENSSFGVRQQIILTFLVLVIGVIIWGCTSLGWYFNELSAVFVLLGLVSAAIMGWGPSVIAEKMNKGFAEITTCCMMIGIARGIMVVMQEGQIIDTVVNALAVALVGLPSYISAAGMVIVQNLLNFLVPSGSGQAVISMPIMAPLSDLIGVSRDTAVLAFQMGDGYSNIIWPTGFAPIFSGLAGVRVDKWWKWGAKIFASIIIAQLILVAISVFIW